MSEQPSRPAVRRVGRRRVSTADAPGVVPREDPTYDDRPAPTRRPGPSAGTAALDARDRWILEQKPPHWA